MPPRSASGSVSGGSSSALQKTAIGNYKAHPSLLCAGFNQDASCISVGTRKGYSITNCEPFNVVYAKSEGATSTVEMLFCTSLVALVGAGDKPNSSTRKLQIVNTKVSRNQKQCLENLRAHAFDELTCSDNP